VGRIYARLCRCDCENVGRKARPTRDGWPNFVGLALWEGLHAPTVGA
jgi:hypothetical protein